MPAETKWNGFTRDRPGRTLGGKGDAEQMGALFVEPVLDGSPGPTIGGELSLLDLDLVGDIRRGGRGNLLARPREPGLDLVC
jgi:hypothetical protein